MYIFVRLLLLTCCVFQLSCSAQEVTVDKSYATLLEEVAAKRTAFRKEYDASAAPGTVIANAQEYLLQVITTEYFDQWNGTEWDFNGTTRTPRKGKIACGYFITTVLCDAGFIIPRTKWAQQASETMIMTVSADVKRYSNKPVSVVREYIASKPDGLYIVGLDSHVGFIYKREGHIQFVHASYYDPKIGVQSEELESDNPLSRSAYRVIGRILDAEMVKKWILGEGWE